MLTANHMAETCRVLCKTFPENNNDSLVMGRLMNFMQVNTNSGGDESVASNLLQFVGLVATVYIILHVVGEWKAADNTLNLGTSGYTTAPTAFTETSIIKQLPDSLQPLKDSVFFTMEALHTIPCFREDRMADANFMRIELPSDESCIGGARSKVVEL